MKMGVYMLAAATAVSVPGIVANQLGWRIGDLSMFAQETTEPPPQPEGAAPQLVSYETMDASEEEPPAELPEDEDMLPRAVHPGASYVALPPDTVMAMRDKILAMRGDAPAKKPAGGH